MFFTNLFESNLRVRDFAKQIIYYTSTQSTNDDIWSLFNDNNKENILVVTDNQLNGRGRLNNRWFSKPGHSITCSFLLNEVFETAINSVSRNISRNIPRVLRNL